MRTLRDSCSGKDVRTDLGWPADGAADELTIDRAHRAGADLLLLDESTAPLVTSWITRRRGVRSADQKRIDPEPELLLADTPASALVASPARAATTSC